MHGFVPGWVVLVVVGPIVASLLLFAGMLFSRRTRGALLVPAFVATVVTLLMATALLWNSDTFAPVLIFSGPWIVLVSILVALVFALRQTS